MGQGGPSPLCRKAMDCLSYVILPGGPDAFKQISGTFHIIGHTSYSRPSLLANSTQLWESSLLVTVSLGDVHTPLHVPWPWHTGTSPCLCIWEVGLSTPFWRAGCQWLCKMLSTFWSLEHILMFWGGNLLVGILWLGPAKMWGLLLFAWPPLCVTRLF